MKDGERLVRSNVLRITRAAPIDRYECRAESTFQNRYDLEAAQRRRVHALVGPPTSSFRRV